MKTRVVIVGAGPAGISAAASLVDHENIAVTLIDEAPRPGGQIFRRPHDGLDIDLRRLLGPDLERFEQFHLQCAEVLPKLDYRPRTLGWNVHNRALQTLHNDETAHLPYDALILATGAIDRIMPVAGWTKPGVFALGGAQALLKEQGCAIGTNVVFCGASPLLYLAALQYHRAGVRIAAVLDTTPLAEKGRALGSLLAKPAVLRDGLAYMAQLATAGVRIEFGVTIEEFEGDGAVTGVRYRRGGRQRRVSCDAAAIGFGLKPETQLAELAEIELGYDGLRRQWYPVHDADGRCGNGVYIAGDGAHQGGAEAASISGRLAACALLDDLGAGHDTALMATLRRELGRWLAFQDGLSRAFAWPASTVQTLGDDVMLCRCEEVSVGDVRRWLRAPGGPRDAHGTKTSSRCGMGRCQGRYCGAALAEIVSAQADPLQPVERMRAQPPVRPLPLSAVMREPLS